MPTSIWTESIWESAGWRDRGLESVRGDPVTGFPACFYDSTEEPSLLSFRGEQPQSLDTVLGSILVTSN